ncbi:hypothetical protein [Scytonema sp. PRP1]|uniref:hypothetical protein n=1 Tax=Scytonema sp. PRP1 TaxID=3120513 RepID=UPI002FD22473
MHLSHLTRFGAIALTLLCLLNPAYGASSHSNFVRYFFGTLQAQKPESRKTEADRLYDQGVDQYESGQFQKSLETYQKVLAIYQQIGGEMILLKLSTQLALFPIKHLNIIKQEMSSNKH